MLMSAVYAATGKLGRMKEDWNTLLHQLRSSLKLCRDIADSILVDDVDTDPQIIANVKETEQSLIVFLNQIQDIRRQLQVIAIIEKDSGSRNIDFSRADEVKKLMKAFEKNADSYSNVTPIQKESEWKEWIQLLKSFDIPTTDVAEKSNANKNDQEELEVLSQLEEMFMCPISLRPFCNPHTNPNCGHTYSLSAVQALAQKATKFPCPVVGCNQMINIKALVPNRSLVRRMNQKHPEYFENSAS